MADLSVAEQRLVGRITGGHVADLTVAQIKTLLAYASTDLSDTTSLAYLASPTFTGDPKAPTPSAGDNDTSIATTAFVAGVIPTPYKSGGYYGRPGLLRNDFTAHTLIQDRLYAIPWLVQGTSSISVANTLVEVSTNIAATTLRLGWYDLASTGLPGALLYDLGTVSSATTGTKTLASTYTLTPGWKYFAIVLQGAGGVAVRGTVDAYTSPIQFVGTASEIAGGATSVIGTQRDTVTGSLPNPYSTATLNVTILPRFNIQIT